MSEGLPIRDFAKASLIDLIVIYLRQTHPEMLPTEMIRVDPVRQAHIPADFKRNLLESVWLDCGPEALLLIGQGVVDITYDPVWENALRTESPRVLFDKWRRIETFSHSINRLEIKEITHTLVEFKRYSTSGSAPTAAENLLICGLLLTLLKSIGCCEIWCEMPLKSGEALRIYDKQNFHLPDAATTLATDSWRIGWAAHSMPDESYLTKGAIPPLILPAIYDEAIAATVQAAADLMLKDIARRWGVAELARTLGQSTRSFQRKLGQAGLSFSHLVRLVRIQESCRLLKQGNVPLTIVGFCAGFSDSAHFSRDFRASMGMTPAEFRAVSLTS